MQLREILDLEAMLTKDPAPENLENEEEGDGEISEKNAGVSFKDEDEVEEEPEADADGEEGDAAKTREHFEEDEEDNPLHLAAMEELVKADEPETFAATTTRYKDFQQTPDASLNQRRTAGETIPAASAKTQNTPPTKPP